MTTESPRVLYFASEYPRATDTFIQREVAALRSLGVAVETVAGRRPGDEHIVGDEQRLERDRTDYILPAVFSELVGAHASLLIRSPKRYFKAMSLGRSTARPGARGHLFQMFYFAEAGILASRLRRGHFDHLHSHFGDVSTSIAMLAGALAGIPFSFTLHGPGVFFDALAWRLDEKIERASFVSCISWFCRSQAQLLSSESNAAKLHIVHCGVDPDRYVDRSLESGAAADVKLAFVARLDHVKGLSVLLEAMAVVREDVPNIHLEVAGDGPAREQFSERAEALGLQDHVTFLGYVSQSEVAHLLARTDVYVLPSFAEGVPVGLMEAQASGLPVVATRVGGISELVEDEATGFLVAPGDVAGLAGRIAQLALDPDLRKRFGAAGRRRVIAEFSSSTEAQRLAVLFRSRGRTHDLGVRPAVLPAGLDGRGDVSA